MAALWNRAGIVSEQLPLEINPFALADRGVELSGQMAVAVFTRLAGLLASKEGMVQVQLRFGRDEYGPPYLKGHISTVLRLVCQRCGEPVSCDINVKPCLSPVVSDSQAASLSKEYEPLVTHGEPVLLADVIEEELLLSIPMFPKHRRGECPVDTPSEI